MPRRVLIVNGHPEPRPSTFVAALASAYAAGAAAAGHDVRRIDIGALNLPPLRSAAEFAAPPSIAAVIDAQNDIAWCDHLVIVHPLWHGMQPALLKAFFEQVMRPGFAFRYREGGLPEKKLKGRTAHIVVTMGMPSVIYRLFFGAHSLKSLERNILKFVGIAPSRRSIIGNVEGDKGVREYWLTRMTVNGRAEQ